MLHPPGFYYVKKRKRFVILSSDKSLERNLSCFFDIIKPRRMEHLQIEEPFSSDPYFSVFTTNFYVTDVTYKFELETTIKASDFNYKCWKKSCVPYCQLYFGMSWTLRTVARLKITWKNKLCLHLIGEKGSSSSSMST